MAAEAAGKAYISTDPELKRLLSAHSEAWLRVAETADRQDALIHDLLT